MQTPNELLPDGLQMDLLWTNASPTSNFAGQTITVNLSDYKGYYIKLKTYASDSNRFVTALVYPKSNIYSPMVLFSSPVKLAKRNVTYVTDSSLQISDNELYTTGSTSTSVDNAALIPYQVYGVK